MERPSQTCEPSTFLNYQIACGETYAVFSDPQSGDSYVLSRSEAEQRLSNLQQRQAACEETQKALNTWPKA